MVTILNYKHFLKRFFRFIIWNIDFTVKINNPKAFFADVCIHKLNIEFTQIRYYANSVYGLEGWWRNGLTRRMINM